jgi:hypothetical protein
MGNYGVIFPSHISTRVDSTSRSPDPKKVAYRAHGLVMFRASAVESRDTLLRTMVLEECTTDQSPVQSRRDKASACPRGQKRSSLLPFWCHFRVKPVRQSSHQVVFSTPSLVNMRWASPILLGITAIVPKAMSAATLRFSCSQLVVERLDPLVNPGQIPSSHLHQVVGGDSFNVTMDPNVHDISTASSCTSCTPTEDFSNYWTAVLFFK